MWGIILKVKLASLANKLIVKGLEKGIQLGSLRFWCKNLYMVGSLTEMCKTKGETPPGRIKIFILNFLEEVFFLLFSFKSFKERVPKIKFFNVQYNELFTFETKLEELNFHLFNKYLLSIY